jgi:hypothetical protein
MPRTIEKTVFTFDELNDGAKELAREWFRTNYPDHGWWDSVYEDAERIAKILGIEFDQTPIKLLGGGTRYEPAIYFSGFWSQGDGACFTGSYHYARGAHKAIRKYAPDDKALHAIADELLALQKAHGFRLEAHIKKGYGAHYSHENTVTADITDRVTGNDIASESAADALTEIMRDFMRWIYRSLEKEHEWLTSNEQVDENIRANEYDFDENGNIA